jgi:hypothetical protein
MGHAKIKVPQVAVSIVNKIIEYNYDAAHGFPCAA